MQDTISNPFAFRGPITPETLAQLFAHHRTLSGGWSMEAEEGDDGGADGDGAGTGGSAGGSEGGSNATDGNGKDLGYPKDTPVAEMSDKQQAAYWRHNARKHETRYKDLTGDRSSDDVKKDLADLAEYRKSQMTPAEQALTAARDEGKAEGIKNERRNTATTVFRGALEAGGLEADEVTELVTNFSVDAYIGDDGVDTTKITNFAKRFTKSGTDDTTQRRRDFGGGNRGGSGGSTRPGSVAQVIADRRAAREGKSTSTTS